ncbi:DNA-directed RNA polymerase subunit D [Candidatus Micrarchaeota archaeon]|nr:DNA-directed RNA polymerase subunit D [Candidatus Micrarchaeota archaeon]
MKIEISKEEDNKMQFSLKGVEAPFANLIRRYIMSSVPVLAIDEVTFYENTSNFFDEYVAHRMGLIPITTPPKIPEDAEIVFFLDSVGPKTVLSGELATKDKDIKIAREKIPIATLSERQALRLEAKARVGTAKKHAKFQAGMANYEILEDGQDFFVESFHQIEPKDLVRRAASLLEDDLGKLAKGIEKAAKKKK